MAEKPKSDWRNREVLLRLIENGSVNKTPPRQEELGRLKRANLIRPFDRAGRAFEPVPERFHKLQQRLEAMWPNWRQEVDFVKAAGLDPFRASSYRPRAHSVTIKLDFVPDPLASVLLDKVIAEIQRQRPELRIRVKSTQNSSMLAVEVVDVSSRSVVDFDKEVTALKSQLGASIKVIRDQQEIISALKSKIDRMAIRIANGDEPDEKVLAAIVMLDVAGWSKLDRLKKKGLSALLSGVAQSILSEERDDLFLVNTWGDALIAAFRSPNTALRSAFAFQRHLHFQQYDSRVVLSWGLVDLQYNHVRDAMDMIAESVDQAARLEPLVKITAPRFTVLASPDFGNLPLVDRSQFHFELLELPLEKAFGDIPKGSLISCYGVQSFQN